MIQTSHKIYRHPANVTLIHLSTAELNKPENMHSFKSDNVFFAPNYRISSNNSLGRLFLFSHQKGVIIRGKAIIRGRRLFPIFLTGGRALNILFYYTIKSKN